MKLLEIQPVFLDEIPSDIEGGKLYISKLYRVAIHLCACGCGIKSVTPLGSGEWTLTDNNGIVTLNPSIGNFKWESPYHAHYFIVANKINWC